MLTLAFDTTSEHGGAGLFRDEACLATLANEGPANIYSISLFQMVDRLFEEARTVEPGVKLSDVELFAVANGPGSFTGIRVGLAAAQAWAKAFDRPARGVSVLAAMVNEARPEADHAVPLLDARRGEFYLRVFRRTATADSTCYVPEGEGLVLKPDTLKAFLEERLNAETKLACLVQAHDSPALELRNTLPKSLLWQSISGTLVAAIARLALEAHRSGKRLSPRELDAYYIRRSDAEIHWKD